MRKGFPFVSPDGRRSRRLESDSSSAHGRWVVASVQRNNAPTLVGAWSFDITPTLVPPFVSIGTFSADGTMTNISSSSMGFPAREPGIAENGSGPASSSLASTFHTIVSDGAGNLAVGRRVRATVTVGPNGEHADGRLSGRRVRRHWWIHRQRHRHGDRAPPPG